MSPFSFRIGEWIIKRNQNKNLYWQPVDWQHFTYCFSKNYYLQWIISIWLWQSLVLYKICNITMYLFSFPHLPDIRMIESWSCKLLTYILTFTHTHILLLWLTNKLIYPQSLLLTYYMFHSIHLIYHFILYDKKHLSTFARTNLCHASYIERASKIHWTIRLSDVDLL